MQMPGNKIVLLNFPPATDFSYANKGIIYPNNAIMLLGTLLKNNGYEVKIIDGAYNKDYLEVLKNYVKEEKVLYVGMAVMTTQVPFALEAAKVIKNYSKNTLVVWGGPHPTLFPEQTLNNENIDIVAINEGSSTAVDLARAFRDNVDLKTIKGIGFKDKNKRICINSPGDLDEIDKLPHFDFCLIDIENYMGPGTTSIYQREFPLFKDMLKIMPILTGLGCAYKCEFCINVILKRKYRFRPAESIVGEIKRLQKSYGANTFLFLDEDFFISKKRTLEFISLAEKEGLHFNWRMWCRVDHFKDDYINLDTLRRLSKIGYGSLVMGAESANQEVLEYLKKDITVKQITNSLKLLTETNIFPRYSFMVGLENETMRQIRNTFSLCLRMKRINPRVDIAGPFVFRLYPGSPIYNRIVSRYNLDIPHNLESWVGYLRQADSYTELPWTPKPFQKKLKLIIFYSGNAFTDYFKTMHNPRRIFRCLLFSTLPKLRLKYFFFGLPFEYWLSNVLKKINNQRGLYENKTK